MAIDKQKTAIGRETYGCLKF